ncbi:hypothetical protein DAPPUDRAFT_97874 [Daphnia pulex]|uniref:PTHB1 platform domain-containing protein n=1 Tax=Daphnia pulex TaxID=6669 RepID=E9G2T5_DAPPU|nr:hypothetical protein DAPPUDRAFT_97874 [Daphnia pulex]|eukprot:EFX86101.1 hypothetical protein DAPPUDRAFT_97874 [Daphnia pulex]
MELDLKLDSSNCTSEYLETQEVVEAIKGHLTIAMPKNPHGNIRVLFNCDPLITATPSETCLQLNSIGEAELPVMFHAVPTKSGMVASLRVEVSVVTMLAGTCSMTRHFDLPLQLVASLSVPVREAHIKVTLSTNQPAANLVHLFQDFPVEDSMSNVIAFKHRNGTIVSLLVSKTTNKYRLQSDSLAALALLVEGLQRRLRLHFSEAENLQVNLDSPFPIQEIWNQVESHYTLYTELRKEMMKLGQTSRQFQIIQRVFHNKILNTKTIDLTQGTFTAVQLAQDHVSRCVQQVELLQEVSVINKAQVVGSSH